MRAELARHFDVIAVVWVLTLMVGFMFAGLSHSELSADQWAKPGEGPHWVVTGEP